MRLKNRQEEAKVEAVEGRRRPKACHCPKFSIFHIEAAGEENYAELSYDGDKRLFLLTMDSKNTDPEN